MTAKRLRWFSVSNSPDDPEPLPRWLRAVGIDVRDGCVYLPAAAVGAARGIFPDDAERIISDLARADGKRIVVAEGHSFVDARWAADRFGPDVEGFVKGVLAHVSATLDGDATTGRAAP